MEVITPEKHGERVFASLVHGYFDESNPRNLSAHPALAEVDIRTGGVRISSFPFPRTPRDFRQLAADFAGSLPNKDEPNFQRMPRFGLTGLSSSGGNLYAGSWNAVFQFDENLSLKRVISHRLMSDLHGIAVHGDEIFSVLTGKDAVVICDLDGEVLESLVINRDLSISSGMGLEEVDWRFVTKQFRGSTGWWHFNYVRVFGDEIWLTSRNASSVVVVDRRERTASMRLLNHMTPVLIHDGVAHQGSVFFTSVDGKIIEAQTSETAEFVSQELAPNRELLNRDLETRVVRLRDTGLGREPNWCRGLDVSDGTIVVGIDGRYDQGAVACGVVALSRVDSAVREVRIESKHFEDSENLRYVTVFDLLFDNRGSISL